jgi:phosphate transport system substrate-binding protein
MRKRRNLLRAVVRAGALSPVTTDGEGEAALGNSAGNYVLPTATTIQAGLASFTNAPANETMPLVNGSGPRVYRSSTTSTPS